MSNREFTILTSHSEDHNGRHRLRYVGKSDTGPIEIVIDESLIFFVEKDQEIKFSLKGERRSLKLKAPNGKTVDGIYYRRREDFFFDKDKLAEMGVRTYESDVRADERYLMERFIFQNAEIQGGQASTFGNLEVIQNAVLSPSRRRQKLKILSLDIETGLDQTLYSIAFHLTSTVDSRLDERLVLMRGEGSDCSLENGGECLFYASEKEILMELLQYFENHDPDILIGWHVVGFDFEFLKKRFDVHGIDFNIGRGKRPYRSYERKGLGTFAQIDGRVVIDGPPALRQNFMTFERYGLDFVAGEVLGTGKEISAGGMDKVAEIERRFREDKVALAEYNLVDTVLVTEVMNKLGLIDCILERNLISGLSIGRLGISTAAFDYRFLPHFHRKGYVASNVKDIVRESSAGGGYVLEPIIGKHDNVVVIDFKSLYPTIMRTFRIDPYGHLMSNSSPLKTPSGHLFSSSEYILPEILEDLMNRREVAKIEKKKALSHAIKILMNSFYGVLGSPGCRFYHADLPEAITGTGQWILKKTISFVENRGHQVLYGDTDSLFVKLANTSLSGTPDKARDLSKKVNEFFEDFFQREYGVKSFLEMEYEKQFKVLFLPQTRGGGAGAKKRYAGILIHEKGEEELSFSGMEFVRSDWTKAARYFQRDLFKKWFAGENLEEFIKETIEGIKSGVHDKNLVYKKRLSKAVSEYQKNIPQHVRAAKLLPVEKQDRLRSISYVMTKSGPVPHEICDQPLDYEHYLEKQIRPLADEILSQEGMSFDQFIAGDQLSLFV